MEINKVYHGDSEDLLKRIPNNFIDLTVTSPPYDDLRSYGGCEWNTDKFKAIAKELFRVTKDGGVVVWIVGDATINGSETGSSFAQALYFKECGFNLHDTMIYEKNGTPFPEQVRYYNTFEYMFILSKGKPKTINLLKDRKNKWTNGSWGNKTSYDKDGNKIKHKEYSSEEYGIRFNIWKYNVGFGFSTKDDVNHSAIFPEKLAEAHIKSWSKEHDAILDPFAGSGTTLKVAKLLNRNYLGFEINEEYIPMINNRIKQDSILAHFDITQAQSKIESLNSDLTDFSSEKSQMPPTEALR